MGSRPSAGVGARGGRWVCVCLLALGCSDSSAGDGGSDAGGMAAAGATAAAPTDGAVASGGTGGGKSPVCEPADDCEPEMDGSAPACDGGPGDCGEADAGGEPAGGAITLLECESDCPLPSAGCAAPALRGLPDSDAVRDAAGMGQMFESISVPGVTNLVEATKAVGLVDMDHDGRIDIVTTQGAKTLRVFRNEGCFKFELDVEHELGRRAHVPNLVDFNDDGWLDVYVTHSRGAEDMPAPGSDLLISDGDALDSWVDLADPMNVRNQQAYSRGTSIADFDGDGWLDMAVGSDNIGDMHRLGKPLHRLYRFVPEGEKFEDGAFEDIGGTEQIPEFGGDVTCDPDLDRGGPMIALRDLDNDTDLDLLHTYHSDTTQSEWDSACGSGTYFQGAYVWKNLLVETGTADFERVTDNGLAYAGRMRYAPAKGYYEPSAKFPDAIGLPYAAAEDVNNDGLLDVLALGPTDPDWQVDAKWVSGRFWYNRGDFQFELATKAAGLEAINWTYRDWAGLFKSGAVAYSNATPPGCPFWTQQRPLCQSLRFADRQPYFGDVVFGDFDNDGWLDFVAVDRREYGPVGIIRNLLFMNRGDGTFEPKATTFSGLDNNGMAAEVDDLNGDGLLDLVVFASPGNSSGGTPVADWRYRDTVYWNTGEHGGADNHWLRLRFSGISHHRLAGARVHAYEAGSLDTDEPRLLGTRVVFSSHSYKSAHALEAHFGLGAHEQVDIEIQLPNNGPRYTASELPVDRFLDMDLGDNRATTVFAAQP